MVNAEKERPDLGRRCKVHRPLLNGKAEFSDDPAFPVLALHIFRIAQCVDYREYMTRPDAITARTGN
jgi:hypothetical protein